jgi:hypothetical protein
MTRLGDFLKEPLTNPRFQVILKAGVVPPPEAHAHQG